MLWIRWIISLIIAGLLAACSFGDENHGVTKGFPFKTGQNK